MKKILLGLIVLLSVLSILLLSNHASAPTYEGQQLKQVEESKEGLFDKQAHSIEQPGSIWWIVSKVSPLSPIDYAPSDLVTPNVPLRVGVGGSEMRIRSEAAVAMEEMFKAAETEKLYLMLASGYRSYQLQVSVYNANVQKYGQSGADKQSARPGTSEHQTGLAADIEPTSRECEVEECFGELPEGKWLSENAYKYGFVVRYVEGKEGVTGYQYEPWHIRYVGKDLSVEMRNLNITTLEEFFDVVPEKQPY